MTAVNNQIASLGGQLSQGLAALGNMGFNLGGATGGGGTTTAATGTTTAAAGTDAAPGSIVSGLLTAQGVTDPVKAQELLGKGVRLGFATTSMGGRQVTVVKDSKGYSLEPGSGADELVQVEGRVLRFDGAGRNLTNFEVADRQGVAVDLDRRQGIASGISNLSRVIAGRQERLKNLSEALAQDANESGSTNQVDIQRLVMEQQVTEHLSNMNHKIYESVQNAISPWLR